MYSTDDVLLIVLPWPEHGCEKKTDKTFEVPH
jgi:hypothetical protein